MEEKSKQELKNPIKRRQIFLDYATRKKIKSLSAREVYCSLCSFKNRDNKCFPSIKTICLDTNLSNRIVIKALKYLCDLGVVIKIKSRRNTYIMNDKEEEFSIQEKEGIGVLPEVKECTKVTPKECTKVTPQEVKECTKVTPEVTNSHSLNGSKTLESHVDSGLQEGVTPPNNSINNNKDKEYINTCGFSSKDKKPKVAKKRVMQTYPAEFKEMWKSYPDREGESDKKASLRQWENRIKEGYTIEEMIDGMNRYKKLCEAQEKIGTQYIKQVEVFFGNGLHFLNKHEIKKSNSKKGSKNEMQYRGGK